MIPHRSLGFAANWAPDWDALRTGRPSSVPTTSGIEAQSPELKARIESPTARMEASSPALQGRAPKPAEHPAADQARRRSRGAGRVHGRAVIVRTSGRPR
jgi:hypothetical protein